ncbi:spore gernimation protein [Bacillus coahuilensis p1.1.43]|uniref:Spore gernimation protein n=1 Tax=Bacillus coahuilensis p1.1.43 TaxID=1150625 RepID=A0A147K3S3_9BACI|nr:glycoside hydrolase family 18 protein [Bacillus coahuilensis]KUP03898.1 spore gernimation protein [Bacillus coahuilensis p1.1.43]
MQIHVVQPGQSVFSIGQAYTSTVNDIVEANQLPNPNNLVVGQALVIPIVGRYYYVQEGDSLWKISQKVGVPYKEIARVNSISMTETLQVGARLYLPPISKSPAEFNAYVEPLGGSVSPALTESTKEAAPYLTYLSPFSFQVNRDGSLVEPPLGTLPQIAKQNNNVLVMVLNNQEEGQFSDELGRILLNDQKVQNAFLDNIVAAAEKYGFRDIHFDFEYLRPADKEAYNRFLRKAKKRFNQKGWLVSTALAPKTSRDQKGKWYEGHDYKAHGEIVDFVVIMTYEWGYSAGPPLPVSPIGPVREVLEYALTEIPPGKILMGQNLYGYDWTLPFEQGKDYAKAVSPQAAIQLAAKYNRPIQYDQEAEAPYIDYTDEKGAEHKVWFEDARSIQAKFDLMKELKLRGMSYWKLGLSFPQNWLLIEENFDVVKR